MKTELQADNKTGNAFYIKTYLEMLENSYAMTCDEESSPPNSRLDYVGEYIFNFTTYDSDMSVLFAKKAIEACLAITEKATFEYIKDPEQYKWFLLMCNMPFFQPKLSWGGSIRGACGNQKLILIVAACGGRESRLLIWIFMERSGIILYVHCLSSPRKRKQRLFDVCIV